MLYTLTISGVTFFKVVAPLSMHAKLTGEEGNLLDDPSFYKSMDENLSYLTNTRLDLSSYNANDSFSYWYQMSSDENDLQYKFS